MTREADRNRGRSARIMPVVAAVAVVLASPSPLGAEPVGEARQQVRKAFRAIDNLRNAYGDLGDLRALYHELVDLYYSPLGQAIVGQLRRQYRPEVTASVYSAATAESTPLLGSALGFDVGLDAFLCRYVGVRADGFLDYDGGTPGSSLAGEANACLPWGPFSIEAGYLLEREARLALAATPSRPGGRFDSDGLRLRIGGLRWFEETWQLSAVSGDMVYRVVRQELATGASRAEEFSADVAAVRWTRLGRGFRGSDWQADFFVGRANGAYDYDVAERQATVMSFFPARLRNVALPGTDVHVDAALGFAHGTLRDTSLPVEAPELHGGMAFVLELSGVRATGPWLQAASLSRRVLPTGDFLLLLDERMSAWVTREEAPWSTTLHGTVARSSFRSELGRTRPETSGGVSVEQQLDLASGLGVLADLAAMRSYYPDRIDRSPTPRWALQANLSLAYSWERDSPHRRRARGLYSF